MAQRTDLVCRSSRLDLRGCSIAQAEEPWTIPACAGYREGDLGQTAVGGAVPGKSVSKHHDPLKLTIPLTCQQGAGPQFGPGSMEVTDKLVDPVQRLRPDPIEQTPTVGIEVAEPVGLQPVGQNTKQQVAGKMRRCPPPKHCVPSGAQAPGIETAQMRDLVLKGRSLRRVDHYARHGVQPARPRRREGPGWTMPIDPVTVALF